MGSKILNNVLAVLRVQSIQATLDIMSFWWCQSDDVCDLSTSVNHHNCGFQLILKAVSPISNTQKLPSTICVIDIFVVWNINLKTLIQDSINLCTAKGKK